MIRYFIENSQHEWFSRIWDVLDDELRKERESQLWTTDPKRANDFHTMKDAEYYMKNHPLKSVQSCKITEHEFVG